MSGAGSVLVADAGLRLRAELGVALTVAGHPVADAGTVAEARRFLCAHRPDVLVLDVSDEFGGRELLRALRDEGHGVLPSVVALAPPTDPAALAEALLLGIDVYLVKPFDTDVVVGAVEHALLARQRV
jgi:DNA-binding response OmpR family regulator